MQPPKPEPLWAPLTSQAGWKFHTSQLLRPVNSRKRPLLGFREPHAHLARAASVSQGCHDEVPQTGAASSRDASCRGSAARSPRCGCGRRPAPSSSWGRRRPCAAPHPRPVPRSPQGALPDVLLLWVCPRLFLSEQQLLGSGPPRPGDLFLTSYIHRDPVSK